MGTDTSLAVLSDRPRLLYDYFKQLFAQVTNPPLDAIREELVTSMESTIGPEGNLLEPRPESCRQIKIKYPVIDNDQLAKLRHVYEPGVPRRSRCRCCSTPRKGGRGPRARARGPEDAAPATRSTAGYTILILSDRDADRDQRADSQPARDRRRASSPGPPGHAHALRAGRRIGRRARSASLRAAARLRRRRGQSVPGVRDARRHDPPAACSSASRTSEAVENYIKALNKGILKVMSKMGISTLQSYCGAQIFEAVGLDQGVRRQATSRGTASRIGGVGLDVVAEEVQRRHEHAFPTRSRRPSASSTGAANISGAATASTTSSTRTRSSSCSTRRAAASTRVFKEYTRLVDDQSTRLATLRGLLELKPRRTRDSDRRGRAGRARSSSASPPARCPTARSARKRTRRWRSR